MRLTDNPIPALIARYRQLVAQKKSFEVKIKDLRDEIQPLVDTMGNWQDTDGHAKIKTRRASVSYDNRSVDSLVNAWTQSNDPIMQSCGAMLQELRKQKPGSKYLEVK